MPSSTAATPLARPARTIGVIAVIGVLLARATSRLRLPAVAWVSVVGIIASIPALPWGEFVVGLVGAIDFLALAVPCLAFAGLAITTHTQLLMVILGGLFVIETVSVIIQIGVFKATRKRVFNMAPIHHHFELAGWVENTVIVRFWIISGLAVAFGIGVFYTDYLSFGPLP